MSEQITEQVTIVEKKSAFTILHDQPGCIGCGACAAITPENWEMIEMNGEFKSRPKKTDLADDEFSANKDAADTCPVNVIHLVNKETKEKII